MYILRKIYILTLKQMPIMKVYEQERGQRDGGGGTGGPPQTNLINIASVQ